MIQIIDNFEHRSKLPNFARDQFDTLEEMKNVRDEDIDEGHISYCISTDKHYKFNASNAIVQSTGKWREFKGEKGDPGKDGQDGTNVLSNLTAFVFKSSETTPSKPVGGSWNSDTNVFTPPTGWYTTNQNMVGTIWMSWAVFQTAGTIQREWSTPVRITGENGKDGQDGKSIEFIYRVSNRVPNSSDKPSSVNEDGSVPDGWTDHPTGVSESNQYEWMCVRTKTDDLWSNWNGPTVWSKWGANGKDGDGVEYIYKRTTTNLSPDRPTEVSQEDDFVPEGWTDDPTGVNENNMYEWVCVRKYKEGIWSEFSNPTLWAKWGEKGDTGNDGPQGVPGPAGQDGKTLYTWIRYAEDANGTGISNSPDGKSYIGLAYNKETASESNNPSDYTWSKITGKDGVAGPAGEDGKTLYTWIKYADTMPSSSSSTIYDIPNQNTKYIGIAVNKDTASESTDAMVYTWSLFRGADGTNGTNGKDGRIVYSAGIYDATVTYTATDTKAPYVLYGDTYYVMNVTTSWTGSQNKGKTPADDYEQYGEHATWIPMEKFEAIYTKLLIADNGTLGKFVFNGDYMFSQMGTDYLGNNTNKYEDFGNTQTNVNFGDTSIWLCPFVGANVSNNILSITSTDGLYGQDMNVLSASYLQSGVIKDGFYVEVDGIKEGTTTYLSWIYIDADTGSTKTIYMQKSGVFKLPRFKGGDNINRFTLSCQSALSGVNITVKPLPDTFIPNLQLDGNSGDVIINKGVITANVRKKWNIMVTDNTDNEALYITEPDSSTIFIQGNGVKNIVRLRRAIPDFYQFAKNVGSVLTTLSFYNYSSNILHFSDVVGRYFPSYLFPAGKQYNSVYVRQYGRLEVMVVYSGVLNMIDYIVMNASDFEISTEFSSSGAPTSKKIAS